MQSQTETDLAEEISRLGSLLAEENGESPLFAAAHPECPADSHQANKGLRQARDEIERPTWVSLVLFMMSIWPDRASEIDHLLELGNTVGVAACAPADMREPIRVVVASLFPRGVTLVVPYWGPPTGGSDSIGNYWQPETIELRGVCEGVYFLASPCPIPDNEALKTVVAEKIEWTNLPANRVLPRMRAMYVEYPRNVARATADCISLITGGGRTKQVRRSRAASLLAWLST